MNEQIVDEYGFVKMTKNGKITIDILQYNHLIKYKWKCKPTYWDKWVNISKAFEKAQQLD